MTTATAPTAPPVTTVPTIRFVDEKQIPPLRQNQGTKKYLAIVTQLKERPLKWAMILTGLTSNRGSGIANYIHKHYGLEAVARSWDSKNYSVFARFVPSNTESLK